MAQVLEINQIDQLAQFRQEWGDLLRQTAGASFFQSLDWLEVYWRHFGAGQKLRVLVVLAEDRPAGILPLVVRREATRVGRLRVLTFPLHDWGSFYGPIGPDPEPTLAAGLEHVRRTRRDWDILELRWQGALGTDPVQIQRAMLAAGFQAYATVWNRTAIVDLAGTWDSYWSGRKGAWLRRFRHAERKLSEQGEFPTCVTARWAGRTTTARPAGTSTTPARRSPGEAGRARRPTARRCRTRRCAVFSAKRTKPPPPPAPST